MVRVMEDVKEVAIAADFQRGLAHVAWWRCVGTHAGRRADDFVHRPVRGARAPAARPPGHQVHPLPLRALRRAHADFQRPPFEVLRARAGAAIGQAGLLGLTRARLTYSGVRCRAKKPCGDVYIPSKDVSAAGMCRCAQGV
jgi:hypothetical protein